MPADGSDDLDGWFEQLANGTASDPALSGLRTLIAAEGRRAEDSVLGQLAGPQAEERAVQRLRTRLSEAHHLAPREATRKPWFSRHVRWAVPAFCALLLTVGLSLYQGRDAGGSLAPRDEVPPTTRSAIQLISVTDAAPLQRAQRIAASLDREVGGLVLYDHDSRVALDFEIDAAKFSAAVRAVKDEAIAQQLRPGTNRIEVTRP
ncbi:hypothetical protein [Pseudorhodoferax sp. Leaf267]|uniref:hypothetical protein n=1 Tax=Pseudorhodoferax sp. Leaf267 TaxID=1736316 RepID=UPI0012E27E41|nr:hypothetical protein [Pseudorhodoferax sp. Leaf267]